MSFSQPLQTQPLQLLILEDNATDAELEVYELKRAGFDLDWRCVQREDEFIGALHPDLDLIIADYQLPQFTGGRALAHVQSRGLDIPFIIVSGAIGEELAVELMKQGVADYLQKDRLARLGQAVRRALEQRRYRLEKTKAERELRELAARMEYQARTFDTLLSAVPDLLSLYSTDQCLTYANRAVLKLWGLSFEEAIGKSFSEFDLPGDLVEQYTAEFARAVAGEVVRSESAYTARSGDYGYYEYFFAPVIDASGAVTAIACAGRDITERKQTEAMLRRERELREIFVSTLSHDMRTPLMAARMSAELLARRESSHVDPALFLGRIIENVDRLDGMIQTLLDANLVRAGEALPLQLTPCQLQKTVRSVLDELTTLHGNRFRLQSSQEVEGVWDERMIKRMLENLISNAVKYGDPVEPITVEVGLQPGTTNVQIKVHNLGEPIPAEEQASLFEPFRRVAAGGRHQVGWGIGLTMVRGAARAHGGEVIVESGPDIGTTFTFWLPRDARSSTPDEPEIACLHG